MELFTPDFGLVFWMFVALVLLLLILGKWGWPVIVKTINHRADLIDKGVEYAKSAKQQLDQAQEEAEKCLAQARRERADMLTESEKIKAQIIEQAHNEAQKEAQKVMEAAKLSIEQERRQAEMQLRNEISALALDVASKVVREQMKDDKAQQKLVNSLIDEMDKQN